jgi:hypothetical protein
MADGGESCHHHHVTGTRLRLAAALVALTSATTLGGGLATAANDLTGFGATLKAWNATHTADGRFVAGTAYDPEPRVFGKLVNDEYYNVSHPNGRVTSFAVRMAPGASVAYAERWILSHALP